MTLSRRSLLTHGGAAAAAFALPHSGRATTIVGEMTIDTVSDGFLHLSRDFIFEPLPADIRSETETAFGLTSETLQAPCNLTLVRREGHVVLFDAGAGPGFQPSAGRIVDALATIGLSADDITHVVFTHAHPDHIWGILDDFEDPVFPKAEHMIGRREFDYWADPDTLHRIGESRQPFAVGAARRLDALAERFSLFDDGDEILPGIAAVMAPGHTPGHMCFEVRAGHDALMILGDAISNHHVAMHYPSAPLGSDQDMPLAAATRMSLLKRIVAENMRVSGFHLPHGGMGRVERAGDGFSFHAESRRMSSR